jgi:protein-disulfide isomerase
MTVEPEIIANYVDSGQVRLVFKPVLDHNPASQIATEAAYCAGEQNPALFWEMHDVLFSQQPEFWAAPDKVAAATKYANELDLSPDTFTTCLTEHRYADQITAQDQARRAEGIRQRPSFRIIGPGQPDGRLASGAQPFSNFEQLIAEAADQ